MIAALGLVVVLIGCAAGRALRKSWVRTMRALKAYNILLEQKINDALQTCDDLPHACASRTLFALRPPPSASVLLRLPPSSVLRPPPCAHTQLFQGVSCPRSSTPNAAPALPRSTVRHRCVLISAENFERLAALRPHEELRDRGCA